MASKCWQRLPQLSGQLPSAAAEFQRVMRFASMRPLTLLAAVAICGCDAVLSKHLLVNGIDEDAIPFEKNVERTFRSFAERHSFTCHPGNMPSIVQTCSAPGPRFLELHRSSSSFSVFLDQPFVGGLASKPPENYVATARDLEMAFSVEFGTAVAVVSK